MRTLKTFSALTTAALSLTLAASAGAAAPTVVKVGPLPGTPAKYNKVFITKYGPNSAKKVLLLIPGTNGGAENFALVGPEMAKKVPDLQVWAMDRREQALEDNSMMQKVLANKATPQQALDYYLGWTLNPAQKEKFIPLQAKDFAFMKDWGMQMQVEDARAVILQAKKQGKTVILGGHSLGACFGDFDGDGHIDLFAGNFAHVDSRGDQPKCRFLRNLGPANAFRFEDLGECGIYYQESYASPACGDFDNDGALDLFLTTVYANASFGKKNFPVLFRNTSIGSAIALVDVTQAAGLSQIPATYVGAWADYDHDGDLDLATAGRMYANNGTPGAHWLELRLIGDGLKINRDAIGAQARIALADGRVLVREVEAGTGEGNANSPILHFGLGAFAGPATVTVRWPDGSTQVAKDLAVDRIVEIAPKPPTQTLAK